MLAIFCENACLFFQTCLLFLSDATHPSGSIAPINLAQVPAEDAVPAEGEVRAEDEVPAEDKDPR